MPVWYQLLGIFNWVWLIVLFILALTDRQQGWLSLNHATYIAFLVEYLVTQTSYHSGPFHVHAHAHAMYLL